MDIWRSLEGVITVELISAEPEVTLACLNEAKVELSQIQWQAPLTLSFQIRRRDYPRAAQLCERRGDRMRILKRTGIYWTGQRLKRRPVLLWGMAFFLVMVFFLPTRIFFVQVEGNVTIPAKRILEAAESSGICFGASRRDVRSERVKNSLLGAVPQLQWAGVNTAGCVATVSVRERADQEGEKRDYPVTSIVAAKDGYILSGTVTKGNALFQVGQAVQAGQVLVSGYTDCGIRIQASRAEGEIIAETSNQIHAVTPVNRLLRREERGSGKKISLRLGKKRINLWKDSGNSTIGCGRIYEEYYATLPGGFRLPVSLCVETLTEYELERVPVDQAEAEAVLVRFAERYLSQQMVAGSVLERWETVFPEAGIFSIDGEYRCKEMIGRVRREQIGEFNGKND